MNFDLNIEKHLLGGLLLNPDMMLDLYELIEPADFYLKEHGEILRTLKAMTDTGEPIDVLTLTTKNKNLEVSYLTSLMQEAVTSSNLEHYAVLLKDLSIKREIERLTKAERDGTSSEIITELTEQLSNLSIKAENDKTLSQLLRETFDELEAVKSGEKTYFKTGFREIDEKTGGFAGGEYIVIAGRPGYGKTALALSILRNNEVGENKSVLFLSGEMSDKQIITRKIAMELGIVMKVLKTGTYTDGEAKKITDYLSKLANKQFHIKQISAISPATLRAIVRKYYKKYKIELAVIDYIQLITKTIKSREQSIARMSAMCKSISLELDIPILVLAQINRTAQYSGEKPELHHLRESGAIEQDADMVFFLHRKDDTTELLLKKQRNGALFETELEFDKKRALFVDKETIF